MAALRPIAPSFSDALSVAEVSPHRPLALSPRRAFVQSCRRPTALSPLRPLVVSTYFGCAQ